MDIENLPPELQFVFIAMLRSAICFKEMERNKKFFLNFAEEIWKTMELTDIEELKEIIHGRIKKDILGKYGMD